jgi:hypothetical protein
MSFSGRDKATKDLSGAAKTNGGITKLQDTDAPFAALPPGGR